MGDEAHRREDDQQIEPDSTKVVKFGQGERADKQKQKNISRVGEESIFLQRPDLTKTHANDGPDQDRYGETELVVCC